MKNNIKDQNQTPAISDDGQNHGPPIISEPPWPAITIDYALYDQYLQDPSLTPEQRQEFIDTLWKLMVSFVDLGFGIHPLQQVTTDNCEQNAIPAEFLKIEASDVLPLENSPTTSFKTATDGNESPSSDRSQK